MLKITKVGGIVIQLIGKFDNFPHFLFRFCLLSWFLLRFVLRVEIRWLQRGVILMEVCKGIWLRWVGFSRKFNGQFYRNFPRLLNNNLKIHPWLECHGNCHWFLFLNHGWILMTLKNNGFFEFWKITDFLHNFQRTCSWNEICKEEFRKIFRCKCPQHYYCRAAGRYYNAYCSMTFTGYIWKQDSPLDWDIRG